MTSKPNWRRVKAHRSYAYDEAARALGLHKNTVMSWVRSGALLALTDRRPHLILGRDLVVHLRQRREAGRQKLRPHELYCLRCRAARVPDGHLADCDLPEHGAANLSGICETCGTMMFKRISRRMIEALGRMLDLSIRQASPTLKEDA